MALLTLRPLLDLQQVDLASDRLADRREKLPERAELADVERRIGEVRAAIATIDTQLEAIARDTRKHEGDLQVVEDKIVREEARLYGGEVVNPKELSALQSEIAMLKRNKTPVEEKVLELMVARDEAGEERTRLETEVSSLRAEADVLTARIAAAELEIDARLAEEAARRDSITPQIPEDVLDLYTSLRGTKKGIGVGALENGMCTACRETLPAMEVDRIRHAARNGEVHFRCEHCRRILVVQ